ncbi:hypothetical protein BC940DRAFT_335565 [Gongronella butleri]|nr:hypothetical protein BC940DRAFT_335565 [Gongronella butleri]
MVNAQECVGQGEGSCQFVATGGPNNPITLTLYNHACGIIGSSGSAQINPGYSLDSQLPYTVDVTFIGFSGGNGIIATFKYGAGEYGYGVTQYYSWGGTSQNQGFRAAFPCPGF